MQLLRAAMRAQNPCVRSISGDPVAEHRAWLFPFTNPCGVTPPSLPLVIQDLLRTPPCDSDALSESPLVLPHGPLGPLHRVLPSLRCLSYLALLNVHLLWPPAVLLHMEDALVERGDISSVVYPEDFGFTSSSTSIWTNFSFSTYEKFSF